MTESAASTEYPLAGMPSLAPGKGADTPSHPAPARTISRGLQRAGPQNISGLILCTNASRLSVPGNICRSPIGEFLLRDTSSRLGASPKCVSRWRRRGAG